MVNVNAAHPGHEVDVAGSAGAGHFCLNPGFLELGLMLGKAAAREFVQDGAVRLVIAMAGLHQHRETVHHLLDFAALFFKVGQVALRYGLDFAARAL